MGNSQFKSDLNAFCKLDIECHKRNKANLAKFIEENPSNVKKESEGVELLLIFFCAFAMICLTYAFFYKLYVTGICFIFILIGFCLMIALISKSKRDKEDLEYSIFLDSGNTLV
jgi:hypothetical protein